MPARASYSTDWIDNSSVHDFLEDIDVPKKGMKYVLITSIDSSPALLASEKGLELRNSELKPKRVDHAILVSTKELLAAQRQKRIFFGFDEIWFFRDSGVNVAPKTPFLVGPERITEPLPEELLQWMDRTNPTLGLGDGTGLNIVTRFAGIPKLLAAHRAKTGEPAIA